MNGVIGMTSLLLDTTLDETQKDYADTVRKSAEALMSIINDVLDFSRIEAGKMAIDATPLNLETVISDVTGILAPRVGDAGLMLTIEYPAPLPRRFVGDAGRIRQVLMNLVSNALKFTPGGEIKILVECAGLDAHLAEMRVSVRDTGVGIPDDKLELIFEKFSQVDSSNTRRYGGTGLGLAIAKQLVDLMHGTIGVRSRLGRGSTFWFSLPLRLDLSQDRPAARPAPVAAAPPRRSEAGVRVLLAEDNVVNQKVAAGMLQRLGFGADVASNGLEALEKCMRRPYDLVFMDCHMPELDGYDAAEELRRREGGERRTTIIALTADAREGTRERCMKAGMDDYIVKPVRLEDLRQALQKWAPGAS
jgi:CheY-like chemotaxis protein